MDGKVTNAGGRGFSAEMRVEGLEATMRAIRELDKKVNRAMLKQIRAELKRLASGASGRYGGNYKIRMRNTGNNPGGSVTAVIGPKATKNDWSAPATRAVIFEFAKNGKTPQAQGMIDFFQSYFGAPGRFLWAEWDTIGKGVLENIEKAIRAAEKAVQLDVDKAGV